MRRDVCSSDHKHQTSSVRGRARYRVFINHDTFEGVIDAFDTEGVLRQNWVNEGTAPYSNLRPER